MYGIVEWIDGKPILDGMKVFDKKDDALEYSEDLKEYIPQFKTEYTIIKVEVNAKEEKEGLQYKSPRTQILEDLERIKLNLKGLIDEKQMDQAIILQDAILVLQSLEEFVLDGE